MISIQFSHEGSALSCASRISRTIRSDPYLTVPDESLAMELRRGAIGMRVVGPGDVALGDINSVDGAVTRPDQERFSRDRGIHEHSAAGVE